MVDEKLTAHAVVKHASSWGTWQLNRWEFYMSKFIKMLGMSWVPAAEYALILAIVGAHCFRSDLPRRRDLLPSMMPAPASAATATCNKLKLPLLSCRVPQEVAFIAAALSFAFDQRCRAMVSRYATVRCPPVFRITLDR